MRKETKEDWIGRKQEFHAAFIWSQIGFEIFIKR